MTPARFGGGGAVEHGGRVVKGGGDGLLCTFESASDALSATVAMQQAAHRLGREQSETLRIRIGVSVGDVSWDDGDCFGMPVVEAARLEATAEPNQILCSALVKAMARGRGSHDLEPVGEAMPSSSASPTGTTKRRSGSASPGANSMRRATSSCPRTSRIARHGPSSAVDHGATMPASPSCSPRPGTTPPRSGSTSG